MEIRKEALVKAFKSLVSLEFYILKTIGWAFFLFGFYSLFQPIITDKPSSFSLIEILFHIKKEKGFKFFVANHGMREVAYFSFIISCFIPMIIGSILLLKNNTKA